MLRTRDYALMLSAIVFLLVGIVTTTATKGGLGVFSGQEAAVFVATSQTEQYEAVVEDPAVESREERVATLRKKIASLGLTEDVPAVNEVPESPVPEVPEAASGPVVENRCASYASAVVPWNSVGVRLEAVEGARLVYREVSPVITASSSASSTLPTRQILAQLPVRSIPAASQACIGQSVIGITKHGSLIRNSDVSAFGSFGAETLVGYALDGFPIYGAAEKETDICGGLIENGQYRYQISLQRDTIITCYAGSPITL